MSYVQLKVKAVVVCCSSYDNMSKAKIMFLFETIEPCPTGQLLRFFQWHLLDLSFFIFFFRAWWSSYSSPPDEDTANPTTATQQTQQPQAATAAQTSTGGGQEGTTSLVDRIMATAAAATMPQAATSATVTVTAASNAAEEGSGSSDGANEAPSAREATGAVLVLDEDRNKLEPSWEGGSTLEVVAGAQEQTAVIVEKDSSRDHGGGTGVNKDHEDNPNVNIESGDNENDENENGDDEHDEGAPVILSGGLVKPGRFAALMKVVDASHGGTPIKGIPIKGTPIKGITIKGTPIKAEVAGQTAAAQGTGGVEKTGGEKEKEKEETGFLSGFFRRLSIDHANTNSNINIVNTSGVEDVNPTADKPPVIVSPKDKPAPFKAQECLAPTATSPSARQTNPEDITVDEVFDALLPSNQTQHQVQAQSGEGNLDRSLEDDNCEEPIEQKSLESTLDNADAGGGICSGSGSGSDDAESLNLVLPEAIEVLMRALQRAESPAVVTRPLLQLESAVAWLPADSGNEGQGGGRGDRREFGGRNNGEEDSERLTGKASGAAVLSGAGSFGRGKGKGRDVSRDGRDGADRERNADALMSRQGWLVWCHRLVEALSARSESGDLVPGGRSSTAFGYSGYNGNSYGNDADLGGSDRWGTGGSEASEAGGYNDDSPSGLCWSPVAPCVRILKYKVLV